MAAPKRYPGMRTIKTGISMTCVLIFYHLAFPGDPNWAQRAVLAGTAAVICLQESVDKSLRSGSNRVVGTSIGAALGCIVSVLALDKINFYLWLALVIVMLILVIHTLNLMKKKESIVVGSLVYMVIVMGSTTMPAFYYAVSRLFDTLVGIVSSMLINRLVFAPKPAKVIYEKSGKSVVGLNYHIKRYGGYRTVARDYDKMAELYLYPETSFWEDRDWGFCFFLRETEAEEGMLEKLEGYRRYLLCLGSPETLYHDGHYYRTLRKFEQDFFLTKWDTKVKGRGIDFNLIVSAGFEGSMELIGNHKTIQIFKAPETEDKEVYKTALYFLENEVKVSLKLKKSGTLVFNNTFSRGDFIIFDEPASPMEEEFELSFDQDYCGDAILLIMADVGRV